MKKKVLEKGKKLKVFYSGKRRFSLLSYTFKSRLSSFLHVCKKARTLDYS